MYHYIFGLKADLHDEWLLAVPLPVDEHHVDLSRPRLEVNLVAVAALGLGHLQHCPGRRLGCNSIQSRKLARKLSPKMS